MFTADRVLLHALLGRNINAIVYDCHDVLHYSFGFYLSSVLVSVVNKVTSHNDSSRRSRESDGGGGGGWLGHNDLNQDRLDLFYWLLAALSLLNFLNYIDLLVPPVLF